MTAKSELQSTLGAALRASAGAGSVLGTVGPMLRLIVDYALIGSQLVAIGGWGTGDGEICAWNDDITCWELDAFAMHGSSGCERTPTEQWAERARTRVLHQAILVHDRAGIAQLFATPAH